MVKKVTFYYHNDCDGCKELKPLIKKVAKAKGLKFKEINVEKCSTRFCDALTYVPAVVIDGKKLSINKIEKFLENGL